MRTIKMTLAYEGTKYAGWQIQPGARTVQGVLEAALEAITGTATRTVASGRTDAGVHALGQVVSFRTESRLEAAVFPRAVNAHLPPDVAVLDAAEMPPDFHALRDVYRKRYRYLIHNARIRDVFSRRYAWHIPEVLDLEAMQAGAATLIGTHDFASFQTKGAPRKSTVRTVESLVLDRDPANSACIRLEIAADGFLYNMVRAIVGTLVEVGRNARRPAWVAEVLARADRRAAGPTAPPQGLFLVAAEYRLEPKSVPTS